MVRRLVQYHKKKLFIEQRFLFQNIALLNFLVFLRQQPVPQKMQMTAELYLRYHFVRGLVQNRKKSFPFPLLK